jgi:RNA polymerase sigma factor (sigma-70 family)
VNDPGEFPRLVERLRAGDPAAADTLYRQYAPGLRLAIRRRLHSHLRARFDSLDFVQDVWASFLALPPDRLTFDSPEALVGYLHRVAAHKVTDTTRREVGRDGKPAPVREVSLDGGPGDQPAHPTAGTATPSQWAIADEELDRLVRRLPAGYQEIVHRLREGYTQDDIARMANVSLRTVNRVVRRLKELTGV